MLRIKRVLIRIVACLNEGSEQVAAASYQVSAASQSLAEGAIEQAPKHRSQMKPISETSMAELMR